jgi:hypothetical protein
VKVELPLDDEHGSGLLRISNVKGVVTALWRKWSTVWALIFQRHVAAFHNDLQEE